MEIRFPLILDGATGTELQKRGYGGDVSAEQWTLEHPDVIVDIQRGYVASQVLYTPTFGANRQKLEERSIFNQTADYNRRLAALSREAAGGKAWIAGDLAPTGLFLAPLGEASFEDLVDIYTEQAAGLEAAGVDLYVIALGRTRRRAGRAQRERQADLRVLHVRRERPEPLGHGRDRRADRAAGHGHQRVRAQLLDRAGTDARAAAPPAGIRPRAADRKAERRYAHHRRRQDRI